MDTGRMMRYRSLALLGLIAVAVIGSVLIVISPKVLPPGELETTVGRLLLFLGPVVSFLIAAAKVTDTIDDVQKKTTETRMIVNGERKKMQTVLMSAIANHPDVASTAAEVGLTLDTTEPTGGTK